MLDTDLETICWLIVKLGLSCAGTEAWSY